MDNLNFEDTNNSNDNFNDNSNDNFNDITNDNFNDSSNDNFSNITNFLSSIFQNTIHTTEYKNTTKYIYLWTLQDKKSYPFMTTQLSKMAEKSFQLSGERRDVYFSLGCTDRPVTRDTRAKQADISQIGALWCDIDICDTASDDKNNHENSPTNHAKTNLPPDVPAAMSLIPDDMPPSIVVHSGHGLHVYWLLKTPVIITDGNRDDVIQSSRKIQQLIRNNAEKHGWHIDPIPDLSRVLRVPGTWNLKTDPVLCEVIDADYDLRYDYETFSGLNVPVPEKLSDRGKTFERRPTDGDAKYMIANCRFLQHCQLDAKTISYDEWLAMLSNVSRASDGVQVCHEISKIDVDRYDEKATQEKINESLNNMSPATCEYIKSQLNFKYCETCGVKCPSSWSLAKVPKARAIIRNITNPTPETVFTPEVIGSLAILEREDSLEYQKFKSKCKGNININDLNHELSRRKQKNMHVVTEKNYAAPGDDARTITTKSIIPECPIDLIIPVGYSFNKSGIYEIRDKGESGIQKTMASGSPTVITSRIYNLDTDQEKIEICFQYYDQWRKTTQPRSIVYNSRQIVKLSDWGLNVSSETAKYLVKFLQEMERINTDRIPLSYSVSRLGWRKNDTEFVLPTRTTYRTDMDDEGDITSAFAEYGTLQDWLSLATQVRLYPFARFILAASFAAPLLKLLRHRNFMVYFWGTSGGGKTAAIKFSESVWGIPDQLMTSFLTTKNGLERRLELLSDFPVGINERQVAGGGREKQEQLEYIAYMLEGGKGKGRANKTGLQKTASWRVIGIANGEEPLTKENTIQGVKNRVLEINTSPILPDELARSCHSNMYYGVAGATFIEKLLSDKTIVGATFNSVQEILAKQYHGYSPSYMSAVSLIVTADYLSSIWLFELPQDVAKKQSLLMADQVFNELPTLAQVSDVQRAWDFVQNWLSANDNRILKVPDQKYIPPQVYGFMKSGKIHVYPEALQGAMEEAGFSPAKILKEFATQGKIEVEHEDSTGKMRYKKQVRDLFGKKVRVIVLKNEDGDE